MSLNGKKVFITGADGFIGSHLTETLVRQGADVTALAQYNSFDTHGWLDNIAEDIQKSLRLERGDVRDAQQMARLCQDQEIIFNLAALITIPYSYEAASSYVETNVRGAVNLLEAARQHGVSRFIQTSTSEVYGTAQFTPITEEHPLQAQSPYAASKVAADMMATSYFKSFEIPVVVLRPFNTYGPRQSERAVISAIIRQALDSQLDAFHLGSLTPKRDFCFVNDTVDAFTKSAELKEEYFGETFNAGTGHMITIGDLVETVRAVTNCDKPVIEEDQRKRPAASEVMALQADASKFTAATGWQAKTKLQDGIVETVAWWQQHLNNVRPGSGYIT
jgi:NAD dependent epimerase/dehydratase